MSCCLHSVGSGSWVTDEITTTDNMTVGNITSVDEITTTDNMTVGNITSVQCQSTHLTSFAVLVDVAGGLQVCGVYQNVAE